MVVVEQAKKFIGQKKRIEIIRSLQTDAGKMMFAKITESVAAEPSRQAMSTPKQRSAGRKPQSSPTAPPQPKSEPAPKQPRRRPKTSAQREAELIRLVDEQ